MKFLLRSGMVALLTFNALTIRIAVVRELADAAGGAFHFLAFLGDLRNAVDNVWQRAAATFHAIHLGTAVFIEYFAVTAALAFSLDWGVFQAVSSRYADAVFVFQIAFLAEATDHAVPGANWAWMWVGAGGWAGSAACAEFFVGIALGDWRHHHERINSWNWALFFRHATAVWSRSQMTLLAGATGHANARADRVRLIAGTVATLALAEFFIFLARRNRDRDGIDRGNAAIFGRHANALFVLQESRLAEATGDALSSADWSWVGIGAGGGAR